MIHERNKMTFQLLYIILVIVLKGFVLMCLWNWFIVHLGQPQIDFSTGFIMAMMFMLLTHLPIWSFKDPNEEFRYNVTIGVKPLVILLFGYLVHAWPQIKTFLSTLF